MVYEFIPQKTLLFKQANSILLLIISKIVLKFNNLLEGPTGPISYFAQGYNLLQ